MRRRTFLHAAGAAALGLSGGPDPARATRSPPERHWTWVHGGSARTGDEWRRRFARLRAAGIHGVLVSGGDTATLSAAAHAEDLAFQRWIWALNRSGDRWVQENHPEWFTVSRAGQSSLVRQPYVGYYQWLCPTRPAVRAYLSDLVARIAGERGVDGVHLDYIRHADVILPSSLWARYDLGVQDRERPEFDFCYCEVCRAAFRDQTGTDPLALRDPAEDAAWRAFRWSSVTGLVQALAVAARGASREITAAVFPTPSIARRLVRQAWEQWPLDAFFPMLYHSFYEQGVGWIAEASREGVRALPPGTPLYAGLYLPSLDPAQLAQAAWLAREAGAAGVALFEMNGLSDPHLAALREALAP